MKRRMRVGVIYGGRSGEHEVSLRSAASVIAALDPKRYEVVPIAITKTGRWLSGPDSLAQLDKAQQTLSAAPDRGREVTIAPDPTRRSLLPLGAAPAGRDAPRPLDVVFPVLHGTYGEDGTIQGLLELADIPYVGAGVVASAAGMDKAVMKSLFRDAGLPLCRWIVANTAVESTDAIRRRVAETLGFPCFVKPANLGSSVGITKVSDPKALAAAIAEAAAYDPKLVIEEGIDAREFECAILGNDRPDASVVGELVPSREFYDYADKYVEQGARVVIPAEVPAETAHEMRALAIRAFQAVDCSGLARVDFFLERGSGRVLLNEINTMPGFTSISMFPKLWAATGVDYPTLVDRLIELAIERHAARSKRRLSFAPPEATRNAPKRARR
jgi:D-alanine-D-alanine ligase